MLSTSTLFPPPFSKSYSQRPLAKSERRIEILKAILEATGRAFNPISVSGAVKYIGVVILGVFTCFNFFFRYRNCGIIPWEVEVPLHCDSVVPELPTNLLSPSQNAPKLILSGKLLTSQEMKSDEEGGDEEGRETEADENGDKGGGNDEEGGERETQEDG